MSKSNFSIDSKFERNSLEYLKKHEIFDKLKLSNVFFTDDKETQKTGSDLIADLENEKNKVIDIKAVAGTIPTFSQEIMNCSSGKIGWIMNNSLATDYYMYVWHKVGDLDYAEAKKLIANDYTCIDTTEIALVKKSEVQRFIKEQTGIECNEENAKKIYGIASKIAKTEDKLYISFADGKIQASVHKPSTRVYIVRSDKVYEQPLNFILKKEDICSLGKTLIIEE